MGFTKCNGHQIRNIRQDKIVLDIRCEVHHQSDGRNFSINLGAFYDHAEVRITDDGSGRVIQAKSIAQTQHIDLSITSPSGLYIITVYLGEKRAIIRVVKE